MLCDKNLIFVCVQSHENIQDRKFTVKYHTVTGKETKKQQQQRENPQKVQVKNAEHNFQSSEYYNVLVKTFCGV